MNTITRYSLSIVLMISGVCCTAPSQRNSNAPILNFTGAGESTELGVVSVKKGVERGSVEWHLVADKAGADYVTRVLEREFGMQRIRSDEQFEDILRKKFDGVAGKDIASSLWTQYRSATFSYLESGNTTIIFFDADNRSVAEWPLLEHVTKTEQSASCNPLPAAVLSEIIVI